MMPVFAALLAMTLIAFLGAHVSLLVPLCVRRPRYRGLVALAVPPLAPYWGWQEGLRGRVYVWAGALSAYALGAAAIAR